jgi:hypothetical protein
MFSVEQREFFYAWRLRLLSRGHTISPAKLCFTEIAVVAAEEGPE